jgi:hypothetical protein
MRKHLLALAAACSLALPLLGGEARAQSATGCPAVGECTSSLYNTAQSTPTISTSAYASGNVLGGIQSFRLGAWGTITNAEVTFNSGSFSGSVNLLLFSSSPTGGGTTDHAALALTSTDTAKLIGVLSLSNCTTLNSGTIVQCQANQATPQAFALANPGNTIYAVAQVIGTPTFAGTSDATFTLSSVQ